MIERLSHEPASALAEDDGRPDRLQTLEVLRAQLSRTISEGLGQGSVAGQWGEIDNAQIAAFLDGSLPRAEWMLSPRDLPTTRWPARSWLPRRHCWTKSKRGLRQPQRLW